MSFIRSIKCFFLAISLIIGLSYTLAAPPSFEQDFANHLTDASPDSEGRVETVFDWGIDRELTLMENIRELFYPDISGQGGKIRDILRTIGVAIFLLFIVANGVKLLRDSYDGNKSLDVLKSFVYLLIGAGVFFGSTWILGTLFDIEAGGGSEAILDQIENNVLFQILAILKSGAFFLAIVMIIWYGYRIISAFEKEDKISKARQGVLNVILALVFIKLIDYIYFIAQEQDFKNRATELIVEISKALGYILGTLFTLGLLYAGFRLVVGGGNDDDLQRVRSVLTGIFLGSIVIFMFLLIIYQVVQEFAV